MDFNSKNFRYVTKSFDEFIQGVQRGGHLYLRSLSQGAPTNLPANIREDFPILSKDFKIPGVLSEVTAAEFSSVLRISGRANKWLHYDVMANIYCQIHGFKRFVLFPPKDVKYFGFEPTASSSSVDIFSLLREHHPSLRATHPQDANLQPGEVLFLPPFWLHAAAPISHSSVAVNVFFKDSQLGYATGRDVYGNRDLEAYEKGREDIARTAAHFDKLSIDAREFYLERLADELVDMIRK